MPFVYGFRQLPKRAEIYAHPFSGVAIATPVLDILMRQDNGVVTDRSPYGNNGACAGCVGARGVFDEGQKFDGVNDTINCGSNASLDIAGDISVLCWTNVVAPAAGVGILLIKTDGVSGWYLATNTAGRPQAYFYAGGATVGGGGGISLIAGRLTHTGFTVLGTRARLFVDGLEAFTGTVGMSDAAASSLYIGSSLGAGSWLQALIELPQLFSGALSPEQVYRKYLEAKDVPIYLDDFSSYAVTPVAKAAGAMCGPFRVIQGTSLVTVDANNRHWVQGSGAGSNDASMQWPENNAYGTYEFTMRKTNLGSSMVFTPIASSATIPFLTAGQNGYAVLVNANEAIALYRITGAAAVLLAFTANGYISNVDDYDYRLVRRVGGQTALYIRGGAFVDWVLVDASASGTNPATDNTYTTAPFCLATLRADDKISNIRFSRVCERPASFPWEFSTGTYSGVVSGSTVWMRCLTAGVTMTPKDLDWQTAVFGVYKGADANVTDILFVASEIGGTTFANQNGYALRLAADESVKLIRMSGGIETELASTADGYVAVTTEYTFRITRNWATNAYEFRISGGAYTDELMFSFVLGIYTSSNYWCNDLDAADRINAPAYYHDIRTA